MVAFKTGGLRLLQAAALISSTAARCTPCSASDKLLVLLRAQDQAELAPLCAAFLGTPASTVEVTVTPTTVASATTTVVVTEVSTFFEEIITVTEPATASAPAPTIVNKAKRSVEYPEWLAPKYSPERVSSACQCLSIAAPSETTVTVTATAEAATVTEDATVTETTISTLTTVGVTTVTVWTTLTPTPTPTPTPSIVPVKAKIAVYRKSTGVRVGYVYMSSGPAITTDANAAVTVDFNVPGGATTATTVRLIAAGDSTTALGFNCRASTELRNYYGGMIADTPTPPGSPPVTVGSNVYETDIWTVNTETNEFGWEWVGKDGVVSSSSIVLYRIGGRMYPVGNLAAFTAITGGASSSKYEVFLKYEVVA